MGLNKLELAYLAGIIDGEGCIRLRKQQHKGQEVWLGVANTNMEIIHWLYARLGGHIARRRVYRPNSKPQGVWQVSCKKAVLILKAIQPYSIVKKEQIRIALEFQRGKGIPGAHITLERIDKEQVLHEAMAILNHRGNLQTKIK